ncbi:MAG TPA: helix-turn-helix transcriptional regulator [Candidatus Nanoarchaeia archaeon]|nr:helix-turn-helix transcriptional regulator [Candidatus Nanoarchaeia archaeon]
MPRKIPDETKRLMEELSTENLSVAEIARRADVSYATAYGYTKARQRGFASRSEYEKYLARQRGFASLTEYQEYLARQRGFASRSEYEKDLAKRRVLAPRNEYQEYLAKRRQQQSINQELSDLIRQRLVELGKTQKWLAEQLGIAESSVSKYMGGRTTPRKSLQERLFNALQVEYKTLNDLVE